MWCDCMLVSSYVLTGLKMSSHKVAFDNRIHRLEKLQTNPFGLGCGLGPSLCGSVVCILGSRLSCQPGARLATTLRASLLKPVGAADRAPDTDDSAGVPLGTSAASTPA